MKFILCLILFVKICDAVLVPNIVGGEPVYPKDKYPFMVSIQDNLGPFCGGSLISPTFVLTAAHCMDGVRKNKIRLNFGLYDLSDDTGVIMRKAKKIIIHKRYNAISTKNDIALIKLDEPVTSIKPISIRYNTPFSVPGTLMTVSGWGILNYGDYYGPDELMEVQVPLVSYEQCTATGAYHHSEIFKKSNVCAGYEQGGKDSCQGDSGGPLFLANNGTYEQTGIVSWGDGCAAPKKYGVYTSIKAFYKWIKNKVNDLDICYNRNDETKCLQNPSCKWENNTCYKI